jgi:hypothetical protein
MPDMLVKLYNLPDPAPVIAALKTDGIEIRRAYIWEKYTISAWVGAHFPQVWAIGCENALEQRPVSCFIAVEVDRSYISRGPYDQPSDRIVGFACYDVASRGMFGPTGVQEDYRGRGIGKGILLTTLHAMYDEGYGYAIIGQVGPAEFYEKCVGATIIEGSEPGVARRRLVGV